MEAAARAVGWRPYPCLFPANASKDDLVNMLDRIHRFMYYDPVTQAYHPDRPVSGADLVDLVGQLFEGAGMVPEEPDEEDE